MSQTFAIHKHETLETSLLNSGLSTLCTNLQKLSRTWIFTSCVSGRSNVLGPVCICISVCLCARWNRTTSNLLRKNVQKRTCGHKWVNPHYAQPSSTTAEHILDFYFHISNTEGVRFQGEIPLTCKEYFFTHFLHILRLQQDKTINWLCNQKIPHPSMPLKCHHILYRILSATHAIKSNSGNVKIPKGSVVSIFWYELICYAGGAIIQWPLK